MMRAAHVALAMFASGASACTDSTSVIVPIVDLPQNDSASAFPLDDLTMAVAHQGADVDVASASFTHGQVVELSGVAFADDLVVHLTGEVGSSEVAYGRTCSFAFSADVPAPQPHLFFAREVKFAQLPVVPEGRVGGIAISYHDGSGLLVGGVDPANPMSAIADVERFDPRTGELRLLATTDMPRIGTVAATLGTATDAQVALIGGLDPATGAGANFLELIEADNPSMRRIEPVADGNMSRVGLTATTLTDGRVIVIGGMTPPAGGTAADVDEVRLANGTAEVRPLHATLAVPRHDHTATRLGDDVGAAVLVAGGLDANGAPVARAELYKPLNEAFSTTFNFQMVVPRWGHQAVRMPDGSVLIVGGYSDGAGKVPVATLELFTQDAGFVQLAPPLPVSAGLVGFAATTLPDGRVLLTGGLRADGQPSKAAYIARLDPINGSVDVLATDQLSTPRSGHQSTLLCDGTVLVAGGTATPMPAERYNPPAAGRR
jgi:hypothetical protein